MRSGITAVTCTGDRPVPFSLCIEYVARQSRKPDQWIIADDGKVPLAYEGRWLEQHCGIEKVEVVRRPYRPDHSLPVNLLVAMDYVSHDKVVIVEDDDWYSREHIKIVDDGLDSCELFGFQGIVYYHVGKRCHRAMGENSPHSSLCQTGMTSEAFPTLKSVCSLSRDSFVDIRLWREFGGGKKLLKNRGTVVGIKGLPGRLGLGMGWRATGFTPDPSLEFLESLIGSDVGNYK
jgi:hypothetical protein